MVSAMPAVGILIYIPLHCQIGEQQIQGLRIAPLRNKVHPTTVMKLLWDFLYMCQRLNTGESYNFYFDILLTHMQCNVSLCNGDSVRPSGRPAW